MCIEKNNIAHGWLIHQGINDNIFVFKPGFLPSLKISSTSCSPTLTPLPGLGKPWPVLELTFRHDLMLFTPFLSTCVVVHLHVNAGIDNMVENVTVARLQALQCTE